MENVVVAGYNGLLGSAITAYYENHNYRVIKIGYRANIERSDPTFKRVNFNNVHSIVSVLSDFKPVAIINCIGYTNVDLCEKFPDKSFEINSYIVRNLSYACQQLIGCKFIHISTDHLFGISQSYSSEESKPDPLNVYAKSKLFGEEFALKCSDNSLVLRTNFFGKSCVNKKSFSDTILSSLASYSELCLFNDAYFNPVSISSLCHFIHVLQKSPFTGILNISSDERLSKYQFGLLLASKYNYSSDKILPISIFSKRNLCFRPNDTTLDNSRLKQRLYLDKLSIHDQIEDLI